MSLSTALARPITATGGLVRLTGGLVFNRWRSWSLLTLAQRLDFRREVGDPATNSIVGIVIAWIARNFPDAPVRIVREDDPEATPIRRSSVGAGAMLRLLEKPNAWFSGPTLWKATIVDYIRGDAYWLKVRSDADRVIELWWVPRSMMRPHWPLDDPTVFIDYYTYIVDGVPYRVEVRDVVHFRNGLNPDSQGRTGVDELKELFGEVYTDEEAARFTASLLKNLGIPGVVIAPANTTGGRRLDADPEAIKQKFQDRFSGDGRGEPLVLTSPTDVKVLSFNPQEMDLKSLRRIPEERISARLGVPAGVAQLGAGLDRNTFTNYGEGNVAAYEQGLIPRQRDIAAILEAQLLPDFVVGALEKLDVFFDYMATAAYQALRDAIWKRAESAATKGLITRARFKQIVGEKAGAGDDVYIRPNNFIQVPATVDGGGGPNDPTPTVQTPPQLAPGAQAIALLEPGAPPASLRCSSCSRYLAEAVTPPYRITCPRCKTVNASEAAAEPVAA